MPWIRTHGQKWSPDIHHISERFGIFTIIVDKDGKPKGKKGEEIPLFGRIVAIADVFDALSSRRVYKEAWDEQKVIENIQENAGTQFDPELVEIFMHITDVLHSIQQRYPDEE